MISRTLITSVLGLYLMQLSGCHYPAPEQAGNPPPELHGVLVIALPRITYGDQGPDPFCEADLYDELHWQLKRAIERRGYRATTATLPPKENSYRPDPWATAGAGALLPYLPAGAQALLRVRVDRYLALDLCSAEPVRTLEMDGSADLFVPGVATPVWSATAKAGDTSMSRKEDLPFRVSAELAGKLTATLPAPSR